MPEGASAAPLRVLVYGREHVLHWAPLYYSAFRECCDVITCGPPLDLSDMREHGWEHTAKFLEPHNIVTEADALEDILALLPEGWLPQLIVQVQSATGPIRNIARAACPTAYISVDSWHDPKEFQYVRGFDFVFVAQKALVPYFVEAGIGHAHWLPLACAPRYHYPVDIPPDHDIVFAGITFYKVNRQRVARLLALAKHYEVRMGGGLGGHGYCEALSSGRVVFNSSVAQDLNMRVFETMAIGRPLLTNRDAAVNGLTDLFEEGTHFTGYDDDDLIAQAGMLLGDAALRDRLSAAARQEVLAKHTYTHRIRTLLDVVAPYCRDTLAPLREGHKLSAWMPATAKRVADVGQALDKSRIALRRMGVEWVVGVPLPGQQARTASYDAVATLDETGLEVDTVVGNGTIALDYAARVLPPGGEVVLILYEASGATVYDHWDACGYVMGFHLILFHREPAHLVMRFRKYARPLLEISEEIFARFPGGGHAKLPGE